MIRVEVIDEVEECGIETSDLINLIGCVVD